MHNYGSLYHVFCIPLLGLWMGGGGGSDDGCRFLKR